VSAARSSITFNHFNRFAACHAVALAKADAKRERCPQGSGYNKIGEKENALSNSSDRAF
jgi:hypothetical protein